MPRKERTNAKTWERDRRNRMNSYFKTLSDLLPPHQEGRKRNKVDILIHASKYIKDLTNRTEELFYAHAVDAHKEELNRLKKLVAQLYSRTQLLSTLLKEAGITVPAEPALEKISPLKWSNKINVDDVDKYLDRYNECKKPEKRKTKPMGIRMPSKRKQTSASPPNKTTANGDSSESPNNPSEDQENHAIASITDTEGASTPETPSNTSEVRNNVPAVPTTDSGTAGSSGPKSGPGIRKLESRKKTKRKKKAPPEDAKLKKVVEQPPQSQALGNLMPGTLILSGGKIMPLMTPIAPLTSNILVNTQVPSSNPIILGNSQANPMIVMQPLSNRLQHPVVPVRNQNLVKAVQKVTLNTVPSIRANVGLNSQDWVSNVRTIVEATKIGGRKGILPKGKEITKTTMTYKVPIPAVHRESNVAKSSDNNISEKPEPKGRSKKQGKSKKNTEKNKEKESVDKNEGVAENGGNSDGACRKRKASSDETECSAPKIIKPLPETCVSIENLRHVVEKIGETKNETNLDKAKKVSIESNEKSDLAQNMIKPISQPCEVSKEAEELKKTLETSGESELPLNPDALNPLPVLLEANFSKSPESSNTNSSVEGSKNKETSFDRLESSKNQTVSNPPLSDVDKVIAEAEVEIRKTKEACDLGTRFDNLLSATASEQQVSEDSTTIVDSAKIILNLDTNTTTTMKPDTSPPPPSISPAPSTTAAEEIPKIDDKSKEGSPKSLSYSSGNSFVPIGSRNEALHSDLSNDLFASLQVPSSSHNPESISPTAAFLMAFPLVSSLNGKTEVLEEDMKEDLKYHSQTPPMLLQIGTIEPTSFKAKSNADEKCPPDAREKEKTSECPSEPKVPEQLPAKPLPKIINNEPMKERLYKVIPYSESNMNAFPNSSGTSSLASTSVLSQPDPQQKKLPSSQLETSTNAINRSSAVINTSSNNLLVPPKPEDQSRNQKQKSESIPCPMVSSISSSRSGTVEQLPKYDSNVRYPSLPEFVPTYSTFSTTDNQMISSVNSRIPYSTSQAPSQSTYTYGVEKNQVPTRQIFANTANRSKTNSMENQMITYTMSQTRPTTAPEHQDYQRSNVSAVMPASSHSIQYEYSARSKDTYALQHQEPQRVYVDQNKDQGNSICQSTYSMHKETQMTYQDYSIVASKSSATTHDSNSQLTRSYIPPRTNDALSTTIKDQASQNTYQGYLPLNSNKEQTNQRNEVQSQSLGSYQNQTKQPSIDGFDNLQRDFEANRKDSFVSASNASKLPKANQTAENQRIETSTSAKMPQGHFSNNYPNFDNKNQKGNNSNVLLPDSLYQVKRSEPQTYAPYPREQKKMFENPPNTQIKSQVQTSLPRYPHQLQQQPQQQTNVTTSNYGQSTITENLAKSTTTVAHNSSNFSILSWTTLSPMGPGSNNNNLVQFESTTEHVDDNEGKMICENFNYNQLHKENVGFGNIMSTEQYSTSDALPGVDKTKTKMHEANKQPYEDTTKSKSVQPIHQQKQTSRPHNQNPSIADDFKYSENKNKGKYPMDSAYTQTEFGTLDQRHQHTSKSQIPQSKPEKTYSLPYDSQVTFDITDPVTQAKCSADIYSGTNYKYGEDKDQHSQIKYQSILQTQPQVPPVVVNENVSYNSAKQNQQQQNVNKSKSVQQVQQPVRPTVNWMMTPEIKHNTNIADIILPPIGKELEFCQNNIFSQTPSYNQGTSNQFYNNYDVTVSAAHSFPNVSTLQSDRFYSEDQPFSWSPTKNPPSGGDHAQSMKSMDQHVVPSTLPTLVGDLALGTNIPEKGSFLFGQMPPRSSNDLPKTSVKEKDSNFQVMLNSQTAEHPNQGTSFLSVRQLVEPEKAEKSHNQQHHHSHHHHHQQPPQPPQPQPRKHQRKSNASPRATAKRQMDMRKQSNDQQMQQHEQQKVSSSHGFPEQPYQQQQPQQPQKYQQNDALWRNRNCKSNYTAEALIGVNNSSIHDGNNAEKQLHTPAIKFSTDYSQNKFPGGLATTDMVMPTINYLANPEDGNGYGQVMNQNFNHSSYTYSPNTNIYPTTNFIAGISNTPSSYMMSLHDNPADYLDTNSFLLPNVGNVPTSKSAVNTSSTVSSTSTTRATSSVSTPANVKNQHYNNAGKHQTCDKRNSYSNVSKKSKRKSDTSMQNLEFSIGGVAAPMDDYHSHHHHHTTPSTFLPPPSHTNPLYQNHAIPNANRSRGTSGSGNSVAIAHHPSGTSLTNFNLSTIFPEINDKVTGYKPPNAIQSGLSQSSNHPPSSYPQRASYTTNNTLGHVPQISEASQFTTDLPVPPPPSVLHYKAT